MSGIWVRKILSTYLNSFRCLIDRIRDLIDSIRGHIDTIQFSLPPDAAHRL